MVVFVVGWGGNQFTPLLLLYRAVEGFSPVEVDILFAGYIVGLIPGLLVGGPLSDRFGRKPLLWVALALSAVASLVLAIGADSVILLAVGRFVAGASVGVVMAVGTSWIRDLSKDAGASRAARRASIPLSAGFGLAAVVAGVLAQWGPIPTVLPYVIQIALCALAAIALAAVPGEPPSDGALRSIGRDLAIPRAVRTRFLLVVLPSAPWVFGSAALAFVVAPSMLKPEEGSLGIAYATLCAALTLATGVAIQQFGSRLVEITRGRQVVAGIAATVIGLAILIVAVLTESLVLGAVAAVVFGAAYGVILLAGLVEVQRMAGEHHLGGITGIFYALTYLGFTFPAILAALGMSIGSFALLAGVAVVAVLCGILAAVGLARR